MDPEWRIYARSSGDDKAPNHAFLTVLRAFRERGVTPTSNLIFLLDGQEEAGSRRLGDYMEMVRETVEQVDIWLFCDGPAHQSGRPLLAFGARGSMGIEMTVYGATRNLHSGHYGNWAPDTGMILARLLASLGVRLVQGNDPAHLRRLIVDHIERQGFHVVSEDPDMDTRLRYPRIAKVR